MSLLLAALLSVQPTPAPPVEAEVPEAMPEAAPTPETTVAPKPGVGPGVAATPTPVAAPVAEPAPDTALGPGVASTPAPVVAPEPAPAVSMTYAPMQRPARDGRGLLIAGGVLTGLAAGYRIGVEAFWGTRDELPPDGAFGRWSVPTIVLTTNLGNLPLLVPGAAMLIAGSHRRGVAEGWADYEGKRVREWSRLHKAGIGLLAGGLTLWGFGRALFLSWIDLCPTNACVYGMLETTFWAGGGMAIAGGMLTAYARGYKRGARVVNIAVLPNVTPTMSGLSLTGRF